VESTFILLVEDNPDDELLTRRAFRKNNFPSRLLVARDGAEAIDYLLARGRYASRDVNLMPEIILLDLRLPKMDGLEVLRHLRSNERTRLLPVVILTSSDEEKDIIDSYALGANGYIRKPVNHEQFSEAIRRIGLYWLQLNIGPPKTKRPR
jgi:two-component system response regulator